MNTPVFNSATSYRSEPHGHAGRVKTLSLVITTVKFLY